ncbi:MmgE/PrpD family protein [Pseudomonas bharatica]|uniref:MmgE/PrpD family protein n=1 Tax=Pseudomonas bharatica TaxID=2692112 RepID=UPI003B285EA1
MSVDNTWTGPVTQALLDASRSIADQALPNARQRAACCLLDWLGVTLAGSDHALVTVLANDAIAEHGVGEWRLPGRVERVRLRDFVLVSGVAGHVLDYDDGLAPMMGHPSVAILPALLAVAVGQACSGAELLDAIVLSVEMAARVGLLMSEQHYERGFHATGTLGAIAAAAGCARLLRLGEQQSLIAIGLAATRAAGLRASFGTGGKALHAGWAALNGYTAARWAQRGYDGPLDILGDRCGMQALAGELDVRSALAPPVDGSHMMAVTFKQFASCGLTHPAIRAALHLRSTHALQERDIEQVQVWVNPRLQTICTIDTPLTGLQAKFSLRATVAMAFSGVDMSAPAAFSDASVNTVEHLALQARVGVLLDEGLPLNGCRLVVRARQFEYLETGTSTAKGCSSHLLQGLLKKFDSLASQIVGARRSSELASSIMGIAHADLVQFILD